MPQCSSLESIPVCVKGAEQKYLRMVTVESDNPQMNKLCRSMDHGVDAAIVIQKKSTGNVQIFFNNRHTYDCNVDKVVALLRAAEQMEEGCVITRDWDILEQEGIIPGCGVWFYHKPGRFVLNGSSTALQVPPTKLLLEDIKRYVRIGINPVTEVSERENMDVILSCIF